jgi:formylglycine-generating enzyme required for sulfatase activity
MAKNWAIAIGINQYRFLQPLQYAKRDAEAMHRFLSQDAKFDRIFLFTDDSPPIGDKTTEPFRNNLLRVFRQIFKDPFMQDGDNFWFFFSGHGIRHHEQDYLMPLDGDPEDVENTGIPTHLITNYLRSCGADNVVVILDACRSGGIKSGQGIGSQTAQEGRQTGVISIFSCSPHQYSYEIEALQQGAFTNALLEGLGMQGRCATVERLNQYLERRVPEIVSTYYSNVRQTPYTIAEPISKSHLILMPQHTTLQDVTTLKLDAYAAETQRQFALAKQLWIRVLSVSSADMDAIAAIERIAHARMTPAPVAPPSPTPAPPPPTPRGTTPPAPQTPIAPPPKPTVPTFQFEVATIELKSSGLLEMGKKEVIIHRTRKQAEYRIEDLGNGIQLEMVAIPGGSFQMESTEYNSEQPIHPVKVAPFFMGKYPVTQAQWQAIASLPKINRDLNPDPAHFKGRDRPVETISWHEAVEFCDRLSQKTGRNYRLPSEAEWEYACRAGTTTPFHFGETITTDLANYDGNYTYGEGPKGVYREETTPVGSFKVANAFGLFDLHGNVWEWCLDHWHDSYKGAPSDGSAWLDADKNDNDNHSRLLRGGSWVFIPRLCRSAFRFRNDADYRLNDIGFRLVCALPWT